MDKNTITSDPIHGNHILQKRRKVKHMQLNVTKHYHHQSLWQTCLKMKSFRLRDMTAVDTEYRNDDNFFHSTFC